MKKKKKKSLTINQLSLIAYSKLYCHFLLTIILNNKQIIMYTGTRAENQKVMPHGFDSVTFGIQACLNAFVSDTPQ